MTAMLIDPTMQEVLRHFYPKYLDSYIPTERQAKTVHHILNCKTGAYGMNVSKCGKCGHIQYHNNSCRDRACPMCQALSNEMWVDAQNENVLDIDYYHLVFTCPSELNPLIYRNQKELYSLFFILWRKQSWSFPKTRYIWEPHLVLSVSCTRGDPIFPATHIYTLYQPAADWTQGGTGIRKRMIFFSPGSPWQDCLRGNFFLASNPCMILGNSAMRELPQSTGTSMNIRNC